MGRVGIYLKDKIEREVRDIVQQDLQNGANAGEANISATCNELIRLGLLVYKRDGEDGNQFDIEGYCQRQDYWPFFAIFNVRYWSLMLSAFRHFIITDW
ncbi:hypothetical protein NEM03_23410, partial [Escherichia coli]|nr:hypothetical protein [Escherichia coli]